MTRLSATPILLWLLGIATGRAEDPEAHATARRAAAVKRYGVLISAIRKAAHEGGPVRAIGMCNTRVPKITAQLSEEAGWNIGRASHRLRNSMNAPDAWERKVLEVLWARKARGEGLDNRERYEVVEQDGRRVFRYSLAIPLGGVRANCHGTAGRPKVKAKLDEPYPDDKARGLIPGDLRGDFTITQPM